MGQVHAKGYFWNLEFLVNMKHLFSLLTINIKVWELQNTFSVGVSSSLLEWSVYSASQGWAGVKICSWVMLVFCLVDMRIGGLFGLRWDKINRTLSASLPYPFVLPRGDTIKHAFVQQKLNLWAWGVIEEPEISHRRDGNCSPAFHQAYPQIKQTLFNLLMRVRKLLNFWIKTMHHLSRIRNALLPSAPLCW